jgi:uncharacterized protein (UPF0335 family)
MGKTNFAHGQLKSLVERIERLEEEKSKIASDIKEVYAEAKSAGFDTTILRKVISLRKKEAAEREEEQSLLEVYMGALGMLPLFEAAETRVTADKLREPDPEPADQTGDAKATLWCAPELAAAIRDGAEAAGFEVRVTGHDPEPGETIEQPSVAHQAPAANPETGTHELMPQSRPLSGPQDETSAAALAVPAVGEEGGSSPPVIPPSTLIDAGDMPAFLDRRRQRAEEGAAW